MRNTARKKTSTPVPFHRARKTRQETLLAKSFSLRQDILKAIHAAGTGHPGGSLSSVDLLLVLYEDILRHDPRDPTWEGRDRFILSAGHLCPALYAVLADQGYFPKDQLLTLRKHGSLLQGHPEKRLPGIEAPTGPLGQGVLVAVGKALAAKRQGQSWKVYCLASDGEHDEGAVWEAAQLAAHHRLGNLCLIIDRNDIQLSGHTKDILDLKDLKAKYKAFGWRVLETSGHNLPLIKNALKYFTIGKDDRPLCIIAYTTLGKGVSFMENQAGWHGKAPSDEELNRALHELNRKSRRRLFFKTLKVKRMIP
jgi:transketolase